MEFCGGTVHVTGIDPVTIPLHRDLVPEELLESRVAASYDAIDPNPYALAEATARLSNVGIEAGILACPRRSNARNPPVTTLQDLLAAHSIPPAGTAYYAVDGGTPQPSNGQLGPYDAHVPMSTPAPGPSRSAATPVQPAHTHAHAHAQAPHAPTVHQPHPAVRQQQPQRTPAQQQAAPADKPGGVQLRRGRQQADASVSLEGYEAPPPQVIREADEGTIQRLMAEFAQHAVTAFRQVQQQEGEDAASAPFLELRQVEWLSIEVLKRSAAVHTVPVPVVRQVLAALLHHVRVGQTAFVSDADVAGQEMDAAQLCVQAAIAMLHILTAPGMAPEVFVEEELGRLVDAVKYHLQVNLYCFHDPVLRSKYRPEALPVGPTGKAGQHKGGDKLKALSHRPQMVALQEKLGVAVARVGDLLRAVRLEADSLLPLIRTCLASLAVQSLATFQVQATALVVGAFQACPGQREAIWEEVQAALLAYAQAGRVQHSFRVAEGEADTCTVQVVSVLVLQIVQAAAELPAVDAEDAAEEAKACLLAATDCATRLTRFIFETVLPAARAHKADTAVDYRRFVEALVQDLLQLQHLAEWPGAKLALRQLLAALRNIGLCSPDRGVQTAALDLLGAMTTRLYADARRCEEEEAWVAQLLQTLDAEGTCEEASENVQLQLLLLQYLGTVQSPTAALARQCLACQCLSQYLEDGAAGGQPPDDSAVSAMVLKCRRLQDGHGDRLLAADGRPLVLDAAQAGKVARALVNRSNVGRRKNVLLKWLAQAGDRSQQDTDAATVRAKAIKALGSCVDADPRIFGLPEVAEGVRAAQADDAVSVREAAVDLIGKYISSSPQVMKDYFNTVCAAARDVGITVRKRAVKILWDCCAAHPGFPRAAEGIVHIMERAADPEPAMKALVVRMCHDLWFPPPGTEAANGGGPAADAKSRARQLADVARLMYTSGGDAIRLPLAGSFHLVTLLKEALGESATAAKQEAARQGGQQVAGELLQLFLELRRQANSEAPPAEALQQQTAQLGPLLALHGICEADPTLCTPASDAPRYVRTLLPYLPKDRASILQGGGPTQRRAAECLLCLLAILQQLAACLPVLQPAVMDELRRDLHLLVTSHPMVQVVASACRCLCSLTRLDTTVATIVATLNRRYYDAIGSVLQAAQQSALTPAQAGTLARSTFCSGQLCRHGADSIDAAAAAPSTSAGPSAAPPPPSCQECLDLFARLHRHCSGAGAARVADSALQAIGLVLLVRPQLAIAVPEVMECVEGALAEASPLALKRCGLGNFVELLRVEEESMLRKQKEAAAGVDPLAAANGGASSLREGPLQRVNGENDSSSFSMGMIQRIWPRVMALARDTQRGPSVGDEAALVRRRALELIEAVLRGGHMPPWAPARALVCLCTDPHLDVAARAVKALKGAMEKHSAAQGFIAPELAPSLGEAFLFQRALWAARHPQQPFPMDSPECQAAVAGLATMYSALVQDSRAIKARFLPAVIKPFHAAATATTAAASASSDIQMLQFCAHVTAALPFKRADEPLAVLAALNEAISSRATDIARGLQEALQGGADGEDEMEVEAPAAAEASTSAAGAAAAQVPLTPEASARLRASLALSMLLVLKQFLMSVYGITPERLLDFSKGADHRRQEESRPVSRDRRQAFSLAALHLDAPSDPAAAAKQLRTFRALLEQDSAGYRHQAVIDDYEAQLGAPGEGAAADGTDGVGGLVLYHMASTRGRKGRGAASTGARRGRGRAAAGKSPTTDPKPKARKRKRSRFAAGGGSEDEAAASGDDEYVPRRRLEPALLTPGG